MDFDLNWYAEIDDTLKTYYEKLHKKYKEEGYVLLNGTAPESTGALVFEKHNNRVAALFYNTKKYKNAVWINLAYVEKEYRRLGFYKSMHLYLENIARQQSKNKICSSMHIKNEIMITTVGRSVGYEPLMVVMYKNIKV